ncbi:MAG TPA: sigma-70 family RNA polymerase sigma factor [Planctomycetota bacterium]|nr:sigma-70 family RNA polymerase sigma factor [Planctomycetota bacterium]
MTDHPSMNPEFDRDAELAFVRAVFAGERTAMARFEERMLCVPRILRALNGRRGRPLDDHDLADLVQDTILIVLRKLDRFEAWVPIEGWIYRLCYLEFLNAVRRRGRQWQRTTELQEQIEGPPEVTPDHVHDDVHAGLAQLGGVEAEVIRMKHFEELTFQKIGDRMGVPANTVKTRYYRGLARLEEVMRTYRRREERA